MPRIQSANPDSQFITVPGQPQYSHGLSARRSYVPLAFQVTSPFSTKRVLLPHALVMHVNPQNYSEQHTKKIERIQTRGGFVEQHWGDDLTEITADGSTGSFMNIYTGLTSLLRQRTIAWDRYRDLHDLFRNNGSLYDPYGNIVLQGSIMLMYDRGTYLGYFRSFDVEETDDQPFAFKVSWTFKVQEELMKLPNLNGNPAARGASPAFQAANILQGNTNPGTTATPATLDDQRSQAAFTQQSAQLKTQLAGTTGPTEEISDLVATANTKYQQGNFTGASQSLRTAQGLASQLPAAPPPTTSGRK
jgi:hypothetical protein